MAQGNPFTPNPYQIGIIEKATARPYSTPPSSYADWRKVKSAARKEVWKNRIAKFGKGVAMAAFGLIAATSLVTIGGGIAAAGLATWFASTFASTAAASGFVAATGAAVAGGYASYRAGKGATKNGLVLKDGKELFRLAKLEKKALK